MIRVFPEVGSARPELVGLVKEGRQVMGSKRRPLWSQLPATARLQVQELLGDRVVRAENCPGGFSPGFASRLGLAGGGRAFVKAVDARRWPADAELYRAEVRAVTALGPAAPAPRLWGSSEAGGWVVLAFDDVGGAEPAQPWDLGELRRVISAVEELSSVPPGPGSLAGDHPRLGGWRELSVDPVRAGRLAGYSPWAASRLDHLVALEADGLAAARGSAVVHFDLYAHNILLTPAGVVFVDWPHARVGAPFVDLVILLSAAGPEVDRDRVMAAQQARRGFDASAVTAVLAAHAGFCVAGGLGDAVTGLAAIVAAKQRLGHAALGWLQQRLASGR